MDCERVFGLCLFLLGPVFVWGWWGLLFPVLFVSVIWLAVSAHDAKEKRMYMGDDA